MKKFVSKFKAHIEGSYKYKLLLAKYRKRTVEKNPIAEMQRVYSSVFQRNPDLDNPKDLIEKIYWMQLHGNTSLWTRCADKYAMREYIKDCGLENYLPNNLGKWDDPNDIDFNSLPNEFVLKTNNGCGTVLLIRDKASLNIKDIQKKLRIWLKMPYGWSGAQLHYTRIKPCIIAEELLHQDEDQKAFSPESMVDYKVWCINGKPENVLVVFGRNCSGYSLDLYDTEWNRMNEKLKLNGHFKFHKESITKPYCLNEMLEIAKVLAKPFSEVRVDFYVVNEKPVIGELTFSTGYGYFTEEYYQYLGNKMTIKELME